MSISVKERDENQDLKRFGFLGLNNNRCPIILKTFLYSTTEGLGFPELYYH